MQQHLSLINKHVNTVKDVPAHDFIQVFAQHLKQINKFKIPDVSHKDGTNAKRSRTGASAQMRVFALVVLSIFRTSFDFNYI
jgi:ribosomal protein S19E (S16A)